MHFQSTRGGGEFLGNQSMAETPQWRREVQASRMPRGGPGMLPLELTAAAPEIESI